ncbi:MAG TPA: phosphoribosylamine--glycine ligase [Verrucomicrobiota bacterium]|nr:phosphoribosylamine--glycine ligase [Verrucomicrobiota bacterium]
MKVLVIGSGGREHAIVWKLAQSPHITKMWCAPGNAGIGKEQVKGSSVECVNIGAEDLEQLLQFAKEQKPDLTVVGPDNPLAMGIVDLFQKHNLRIWGPSKKAAQFESSKAFSQQFMEKYGIPSPKGAVFTDFESASKYAASFGGRCAIKADGLALGKGVVVCRDMEVADKAIENMLVKRSFGKAGEKIVIQELLNGTEISLHALCDGKTALLFPTSQDHKRAYDDDKGPNTGGMGTYCPTPFLDEEGLLEAKRTIIDRWLRGCNEEQIDYRGIIYPGVMLTNEGIKVLEFNARFGDPETQVYLYLLENDLLELLMACLDGTLDKHQLKWKNGAAVCVIMASGGYPGSYQKGKVISGIADAEMDTNVKVFNAGTALNGDKFITNGGRVLGVTAYAETLQKARDIAYAAVDKIKFEGAHFRRDIAAKALKIL